MARRACCDGALASRVRLSWSCRACCDGARQRLMALHDRRAGPAGARHGGGGGGARGSGGGAGGRGARRRTPPSSGPGPRSRACGEGGGSGADACCGEGSVKLQTRGVVEVLRVTAGGRACPVGLCAAEAAVRSRLHWSENEGWNERPVLNTSCDIWQ